MWTVWHEIGIGAAGLPSAVVKRSSGAVFIPVSSGWPCRTLSSTLDAFVIALPVV